jgi:hypothetical protein
VPILYLAGRADRLAIKPGAAALGLVMGVAAVRQVYYYRTQPLALEFEIAREGRRLGSILNELFEGSPPPSVGAVTVGGLAKAYRGRVWDLMGLCWVDMARAGDGRRTRFRNHSAFDAGVFLDSPPDVALVRFLKGEQALTITSFENLLLDGLHHAAPFRARFVPCQIRLAGSERLAFYARKDWLEGRRDPRITILDWSDVRDAGE